MKRTSQFLSTISYGFVRVFFSEETERIVPVTYNDDREDTHEIDIKRMYPSDEIMK